MKPIYQKRSGRTKISTGIILSKDIMLKLRDHSRKADLPQSSIIEKALIEFFKEDNDANENRN